MCTLVGCASPDVSEADGAGEGPQPCQRFIECVAAVTPQALPAAVQGYGPEGVCWAGDSALCEKACADLTVELAGLNPDTPQCAECRDDVDCGDGLVCSASANICVGSTGLDISCLGVPRGLVGVDYVFTPTVGGDLAMAQFAAEGLPAGLSIDPLSGVISGVPSSATLPGDAAAVTISVSGASGFAEVTCDFEIAARFAVDVGFDATEPCLGRDDRLADFVVEGTGDGTAVTCRFEGDVGDGVLPDGLSMTPDCVLEGSATVSRFGTRVFVVRAEQSGVPVYVPYCITDAASTGYSITIEHSGMGRSLRPIVRSFNPNAALAVGQGGDPLVRVVDSSVCNGVCNFRFAYTQSDSPFNFRETVVSFDLYTDPELGQDTGFEHGLILAGRKVDEAFATRPWTVNVDFDYCLSAQPCPVVLGDGSTGGRSTLGVLMWPEG